jgi:hypothetical protein
MKMLLIEATRLVASVTRMFAHSGEKNGGS